MKSSTVSNAAPRRGFDWGKARKMKVFYLMLLVPVAWLLIFCYEPMYGVIIAFKDYKIGKGIWGSNWNGFENFSMFFSSPLALRVIRNTVILSVLNLLFGFPAPILLALMLNEIKTLRFKKIVQTISYLPYFLSWVVLAVIVTELLSPTSGIVNTVLSGLGMKPIYFLADKSWIRTVLVSTGLWQSVGWGSIIYLASIASINPELYEASRIDGATRLQDALYITVPSLAPIITFYAIMNMGSILGSNFEQIYNLQNSSTIEISEVISTYVYKVGLIDSNYGFSTAVGLFTNVVGIVLIAIANMVVKRINDYAIW